MAEQGPSTPLERRLGLDTLAYIKSQGEYFELLEHKGRYALIVHNDPGALGVESVTLKFSRTPSAIFASLKTDIAREQLARHMADDLRLMMRPVETARDFGQFAVLITELRMMTEYFLKRMSTAFGVRYKR